MSLRVCVITAAYPAPSEPTRAVFIENLLRAFVDAGDAVTVVAPRVAAADPPREERAGVRVERFSYGGAGRRLKELDRPSPWRLGVYIWSAFTRALRVARRQRPDVVYAHWLLPAGFVGAMVATLLRAPLVIHVHGSDVHRYAPSSRLASLIARWTLRRAASVLAVSADLAARLDALGVPPERTHVVPMGCDERVFKQLDNGPKAAKDAGADGAREDGACAGIGDAANGGPLVALYVGDLEPGKGIAALAREIAAAPDDAVELEIVGDGVDRAAIEAFAGKRVRLLGRLSQAEVAACCRRADVLVLPSRVEGAPLAVMEALSCGLPVVATPVGGVPELVRDGETGWLASAERFGETLAALAADRETLERARARLRAAPGDHSAARRGGEARGLVARACGGGER